VYDRERLWLCRKRREPRLELELLRVCIGSNKAHETGVSEALADEYWLGSTKLNTQVTHLEGPKEHGLARAIQRRQKSMLNECLRIPLCLLTIISSALLQQDINYTLIHDFDPSTQTISSVLIHFMPR